MASLIEKVQKLLSLSQSDNVNEAATAFAVAQKLIFQHNLDISQLDEIQQPVESIVDSQIPLYTGKRVVHWKSHLAFGLAKLNSCTTYISHFDGIAIRIVGHESNVELVRYFFNSIVSQIEFLSDQALKAGKGSGKTFTNNLKHSATITVIDRLSLVRKEFQQEHGSTAMVLVDQKATEVKMWVSKNLRLKESVAMPYRPDANGWAAGVEAGKQVSLNKPLNSGNQYKRLN